MPNNTPNPPRQPRRILRATTLATLIATAAYIAGAVQFYLSKPNITRDYFAEHNAANAALSEDEKAWPVYHDAQARWYALAGPINARVGQLQNEFADQQRQLETDDPHYDRIESPFTNPENPFGIPADHPLHADALAALEAFQPTLAEIRQAAFRKSLGIPLTNRWFQDQPWTPGAALEPTPDLSNRPLLLGFAVQKIAPVGFLRSVFQFDNAVAATESDPVRVIDNTHALIHIARQMHTEQTLIDQLIASRFLITATDSIDKILDGPHQLFSQDQLHTLQNLLWSDGVRESRINFAHDRSVADELIERAYPGQPGTKGSITIDGINLLATYKGDAPIPRVFLAAMWPTRYRLATRSDLERNFADGFQAAELLSKEGPRVYPIFLKTLAEIEDRELTRAPSIASILIAPLGRSALTVHLTRTRLHATATRLALERHKLAEGHYPDTLEQLVPTYLPQLPADPFNPGHPIKYLLRDNHPILYSIGANGIDNQATPAPRNVDAANLEARFANPTGPSPTAPQADWILSPPQP